MSEPEGFQDANPLYLTELSRKDSKFDLHKANSQHMARLYEIETIDGVNGFISGKRAVIFGDYSIKLENCGAWLRFVETPEGLKLIDARFCKVPNCPTCQWRRSLKWRAKFLELLPVIQEQYANYQWIFLTLTIKNCELNQLKTTIKTLNEAFNRLYKLARFPFVGLVKSVEVTRIWDCYDGFTNQFVGRHGCKWIYDYQAKNNTVLRLEPTTEVHPHLHVIGLVKASYFSGNNYIKHDDWVSLWQQSLRVDYTPIVNIKAVKCRKGRRLIPEPDEFDNQQDNAMISAICETLKYTVKEQDLIGNLCSDDEINSQWLKGITEQLYKTRKVEYRGILKELGKELEAAYNDDDLIQVNQDNVTTDQPLKELTFTWYKVLEKYVLSGERMQDARRSKD